MTACHEGGNSNSITQAHNYRTKVSLGLILIELNWKPSVAIFLIAVLASWHHIYFIKVDKINAAVYHSLHIVLLFFAVANRVVKHLRVCHRQSGKTLFYNRVITTHVFSRDVANNVLHIAKGRLRF